MLPMELPPRARRILRNGLLGPAPSGTTSACAENTATILEPTRPTRNYLRVRGEYSATLPTDFPNWELPPRARRIQQLAEEMGVMIGTTSACAENTTPMTTGGPHGRNYLRVRGEYPSKVPRSAAAMELPPRARRIQCSQSHQQSAPGTTSACAENTVVVACVWGFGWNYLRVRGEYCPTCGAGVGMVELPPRARRIHTYIGLFANQGGTTSACAENTDAESYAAAWFRNYLRVRGEY